MPALIGEKPLISVLIPAWNEAERLQACVESFITLRYPNTELILCVGGEDGTLELAESYIGSNLLVLKQAPGEGKQSALQKCFEQSSGEIIFMSDADCVWDDEAFEGTLERILEGKEMVVTGSWKPLKEQAGEALVQIQWWQHMAREITLPTYIHVLHGCNTAIHRRVLDRVGGFLSDAPIGTDYILGKRVDQADYQICFIRKSRVQTEYPTSIMAYIRQRSRWQRNCFLYGIKYKDWIGVVAQVRMSIAAMIMLALPFFAIMNRYYLYLWLFNLVYLYLVQVRLYQRVKKWVESELLLRPQPVYLLSFLVVDWLASVVGLIEAFNPLQRWKW